MRGTTIALCFVLALSCGSAAVHGQASDAVNALSEERRAEVMRQLIESADYPCGRVARVFFKGENSYNDTANYTVRCDADSDYIVSIENRGQMGASVLDCVMVRLIGTTAGRRSDPDWGSKKSGDRQSVLLHKSLGSVGACLALTDTRQAAPGQRWRKPGAERVRQRNLT